MLDIMKVRALAFALLLVGCNQTTVVDGGNEGGGGEPAGGETATGSTTAGAGGGDSADDRTILLSDLRNPRLVRCDSRWLYWVDGYSGDVFQGRIEDPSVNTQLPKAAPGAVGAAMRDEDVLYAVPDSGEIVSVPKNWDAPSTFASAPDIAGIYAHGEDVYWYTQLDIFGPDGHVYTSKYDINGIAVDDTGVYVATDNGVYALALDGSDERLLAQPPSARAIAVAGDNVVYSSATAVMVIAKGGGTPERIGPSTATSIIASGDVFAWSSNSHVYAKSGDDDARMVAAVYGDGGVALCSGHLYWASPGSGQIVRATP